MPLGDTISVLIEKLEGARQAKGMSRVDFAQNVGLALETIRAWRLGKSKPGAIRLAAAGLALGLRLELIPTSVGANTQRGLRNPPPPQRWWVDRGWTGLFQGSNKPKYLVNLAIAEIRWRTANAQIAKSNLHRGTPLRVWHGHQRGRSPTARTLLELAAPVGLTLGWVPEEKSWRKRPWQQKWKGEHPIMGTWSSRLRSFPIPQNLVAIVSTEEPIVDGWQQLKLFQ